MIESMRARGFLVLSLVLFATIYLLPNFVELPKGWWFYKKQINYGLDIQGGAHLVYSVDVATVLNERTDRMARALADDLKEDGVELTARATEAKDAILLDVKNDADKQKLLTKLKDFYGTTLQVIASDGLQVEVRYFEAALEEYRTQLVSQAIEVIRNRVDEFGVAEPIIAAQGRDRILVQLPGVSDSAHAKQLINKTARLDFRIVDETLDAVKVSELVASAEKEGGFGLGKDKLAFAPYAKRVNEALKGKLPPNTIVSFEKAPNATSMEAGKIAYLLRTDSDISGDLLEDAFVSYEETGAPRVAFRFNPEGSRKFGELTGKNINRRLAIVLDDVIYSAPNIQSRIDREGTITLGRGNFEDNLKEAQLISTTLRAGALPATLQQVEERTVGPSLGQDSINKGKTAGLIGMALVVAFIIFWYKMVGVVAAVCLGINMMLLLALLSALGATLTLPGIAGITLTMGMAIDANVIIFERIKEELARGVTMKRAIQDGFDRAWSAIFDSNVTNAIAAGVLVYFGTGPVRGFGVTLIAGIITTMITAVFVSHYFLDLLTGKSAKKIAI